MKKLIASVCICALALMCIFVAPTVVQAATAGGYIYEVANEEATITGYNGAGDEIKIPATLGGYRVTTIGASAFANNSSLTGVTIPVGVSAIGDKAFYNCAKLNKVTIEKRVSAGVNGDIDFDSLIGVTNPATKTTIGNEAFSGCAKLEIVTIAEHVVSVGDNAFAGCDSLAIVRYSGTQAEWKAITMGSGNESLKKAAIYCSDHTHIYESVVTPPTCTEGGYTTYTCACTDSYVADETKALDHNYKNGSCTRCGDTPVGVKLTKQPTVGVAPSGKPASATVQATGDGLSYTWYHKNASASKFAKAGTTGATYTAYMSASSNGRYVYCVVADKYGNEVTSNTVRLYMGNPAKITTQPTNGAAPSGKAASVSVKATGDGLTYTWYHKNATASKFAKAGETSATYTAYMSASSNGRYVYCIVTDQYGTSVKTNTVRLYMGNPAKITAQPTNAAAPSGKAASVSVKATGDGLTYTWYHKNATASKFAKANVTGATYTAYMSASSNGRYAYCVITDQYGTSVQTQTVRLYMGNPAKITAQPANGAAPSGKAASVTVRATGDGLTYTWYHKNATASKFAKASVTGATYTAYMSASSNGRYVYCVITDQYGTSVQTQTVRLYMGNPAKITAQPANGAAPSGKAASVTVKATGDGLTYTWYHKNATASKFAKAGTTGATYTANMSSSSNGRYVYCVITDKYGTSVTTETVRLYVGNPAKITAQPVNGTAPSGKAASVTVKATGDGLTYTWYHKNATASKFAKASVTGATYSAYMSASSNGRSVYCVITDKYGTSVTTNTVTLNIK